MPSHYSIKITPACLLPDFHSIAEHLWGAGCNIDSDGDCSTPEDRHWTELTLILRSYPNERIDIDPVSTAPLTLDIRSSNADLCQRAADFILSVSGGFVTHLGRATIAKANLFRIACLHTAASNISVFDAAAKALGIEPDVLHHEVRPDLLAAAEQAGHLTADIVASTASALLALARRADAVVLTCSTLGPAVEHIPSHIQVPILRADEALAIAAVNAGGKIVVLCAVETTLEPTSRIFHQATQHSTASVQVQWVPSAWELFKAGNIDAYLAATAQAADRAYVEGASIVALGQASMSAAALLVTAGPTPLTSAATGLTAAMEALRKRG
ncbi:MULTISPECIES: aspartate/glutamate racemase family protein [Pseudomonas]|uniref:aspartate/glutamate racemase family protein n=1 Tax=Pseudomonas TaxID=286 RepID=UPI0008123045|nr:MULTISPECIES: aspartate/glutamate racemase family protein [unclassified Pseudomonas]CRM21936.1 Asp/Glu/Hydantoin racemase [Pseudomonas sp. 52 E 6]